MASAGGRSTTGRSAAGRTFGRARRGGVVRGSTDVTSISLPAGTGAALAGFASSATLSSPAALDESSPATAGRRTRLPTGIVGVDTTALRRAAGRDGSLGAGTRTCGGTTRRPPEAEPVPSPGRDFGDWSAGTAASVRQRSARLERARQRTCSSITPGAQTPRRSEFPVALQRWSRCQPVASETPDNPLVRRRRRLTRPGAQQPTR